MDHRKRDDSSEEEEEEKYIEPIAINQKMQNQGMEEEGDEQLNLDFIFLDPSQRQFTSVKVFINGYLDGLSFKSSELATLIIDQVQIGTMIGADEEDDQPNKDQNIFAMLTILNVGMYSQYNVMKEIINYVLDKSAKHNQQQNHAKLLKLLNESPQKIGLLINERILNLVPQLVPVLHNQVVEDLNWLKNQDQQEWKNFQFEYLLILSKCYKSEQKSTTNKKIKANSGSLQLNDLIYQKYEDYHFFSKSEFYFSYEAHSTKNVGGLTNTLEKDLQEEICIRIIALLPFKDYLQIVPKLGEEIQ